MRDLSLSSSRLTFFPPLVSDNGVVAQEEERNLDEFENIISLMEEAAETIEPFSKTSSNELSELFVSN